MIKTASELNLQYRGEQDALIDKIKSEYGTYEKIEDPRYAFEYFVSTSAMLQFYANVINLTGANNNLSDIPILESQIEKLERFKNEFGYEIKDIGTTNVVFFRLNSGYYKERKMEAHDATYTGLHAILYGEYILLYDFLKERINEFYLDNQFSKLSADKKLDEVLRIMKENQRSNGLDYREIFLLMKASGYICPYTILKQILQKLSDEHYIYNIYDNNALTFNGSFFVGYENQTYQNREKALIEISRSQSLNYATWAAGVAGSCVVLLEVYKLAPRWMPLSTIFYLLLIGGVMGIGITMIVPYLGKSVRGWLNK